MNTHDPRTAPWQDVTETQWSDWRWQLRQRLTTADDLSRVVRLTDEEREACVKTATHFRLGVTPYYASLMDRDNPECPIRRQAIPRLAELETGPEELTDPLAEERDMPVPGITHRYPDRVLLYATHTCAVYCRHCTRRRKVSDPGSAPPRDQIEAGIAYIAAHPEIRDVIVSGGDPLSLSESALERILVPLHAIEHLDYIRIGTRKPVTLPQRITPELCALLKRLPPIYIMTHFNHPSECTPEAAAACTRLVEAGCLISNQMVLLKGVNDDAQTVCELSRRLLRMRVWPYRMYHCDYTAGTGQFRTPISKGVAIWQELHGRTSGLAVPPFEVDLPRGGGKVGVPGPAAVQLADGRWKLTSFRGEEMLLRDS